MKISKIPSAQAFGAEFITDQNNFKKVIEYAQKTKKLPELDSALNKIKHINPGFDILIIQGKREIGLYSGFYCPQTRKSIRNIGATTPEEATLNGIISLANRPERMKNLLGSYLFNDLTPEYILERYSAR